MKRINSLPFDPKGKIFHWGPVPGKFFYCSTFTEVHYKYFRARYKENWSETLWLFKNGRMFWINNFDDIQAVGLKVFLKYLLPVDKRKKIYKEWRNCTKKILQLQKKIDKIDLKKLTNKQLKRHWEEFHKAYINFWVSGSIPELANYGSEKYLRSKLDLVVKNEMDVANIMEVLTAPTKISFYQKEEIDLLKTNNLLKHQQKYFWLRNSYAGTEILPLEFFEERKTKLSKNLEKEMKSKVKETIENKKLYSRKYGLNSEIIHIGKAISDGVSWQDERKKNIFIILHYQDLMLKEVFHRFSYTDEELHRAWYFEITDIIDGKNLHKKLGNTKDGFGVHFFHSSTELNPKQTEFFWKLYDTKVEDNMSEVRGIVASKGKNYNVKGVVRILLDPLNISDFKDNEILVAPMTSPEYIFAMKKACAVVTDTGGLTSHAAIVSRELNIPCIVGAKGVTKIFKDGDIVEVNVSNGIVKKI